MNLSLLLRIMRYTSIEEGCGERGIGIQIKMKRRNFFRLKEEVDEDRG
mgnify:CR=1 FL=1